jgi:hypothetical protein
MESQFSDFEQRCDEELAAADRASSHEDRVAHLEQALRLAQLASRVRPRIEVVKFAHFRHERDSAE